jgi:hypothetical protein
MQRVDSPKGENCDVHIFRRWSQERDFNAKAVVQGSCHTSVIQLSDLLHYKPVSSDLQNQHPFSDIGGTWDKINQQCTKYLFISASMHSCY